MSTGTQYGGPMSCAPNMTNTGIPFPERAHPRRLAWLARRIRAGDASDAPLGSLASGKGTVD
jgi:hypothetical protein